MKNRIINLLSIGLLLIVGGCASLTPTQSARIEAGVKSAAQIGGGIILLEHPEWRRGFMDAEIDLGILADAPGAVGLSEVVAIVQRLNVKELKSPHAQLIIAGGITLLDSFGQTELNPQSSEQVKAIAGALRDGLRLALAATQ